MRTAASPMKAFALWASANRLVSSSVRRGRVAGMVLVDQGGCPREDGAAGGEIDDVLGGEHACGSSSVARARRR